MHGSMRLQSAIEFLTTYGFMITILTILLIIIIYVATPASSVFPSQCSAYGGFVCAQAAYYANTVSNNANVVIFLSNSGSSPTNILSANVIINGQTITGQCNPTFLVPGSNTVCIAIESPAAALGSQINGQFSIAAQSCNSGISRFSQQSCSFIQAKYAGSFLVYVGPSSSSTSSTSTSTTSTSTIAIPTCTGSGTNTLTLTSYESMTAQYPATVSYTMYGGGGGGGAGSSAASGTAGESKAGSVPVAYGEVLTIYVGAGGGGAGNAGAGGGSGYFGGGGGGSSGYAGGGGGSS